MSNKIEIVNMTAEEFLRDKYNIKEELQSNSKIEDMQEYARIKCKELLEIVAEKAKILNVDTDELFDDYMLDEGYLLSVDKDSILNAVDLEKFCAGTTFS